MKQITSYKQVQELRIGSIIVQNPSMEGTGLSDTDQSVQFSVQNYTPIGWEDIEFELLPVETTPPSISEALRIRTSRKTLSPDVVNVLGSEFVKDCLWWIRY